MSTTALPAMTDTLPGDANMYRITETATFAYTFQDAAVANGNGTANYVLGMNTVVVQAVVDAAAATLNFEASVDGTNYLAILTTNVTSGVAATTATVSGIYEIPCSGFKLLRCRISGYGGPGAVTVSGYGTITSPMFSEAITIGSITASQDVAKWGGTATTLGQKTMAASVPMTLASDQGAVPTRQSNATSAVTSVADNAASVTLLAANANRRGATIHNTSSARLFIKLGATATTTTSHTASLSQYGYYEVPFGYTGIVDGIWSSDPGDGSAQVTEITV